MALQYLFQKIIKDAALLNISADMNKRSREYFKQKAGELQNQRPANILKRKSVQENATAQIPFKPGDIFLFNYMPKNATNERLLPYYDRYPLIVLVDVTPEYVCGLNFHYLPYEERAVLLTQLYNFLVEDTSGTEGLDTMLGDKAFLDVTYDKIKLLDVPKSYWKPCFKKYLNTNIRGKLLKIHPQEWDIILQLPLERFVRANRQRVFNDSRNKWNK
jgi:hypothetical protein